MKRNEALRAEVLRLRLQGCSLRKIGLAVGITGVRVHQLLKDHKLEKITAYRISLPTEPAQQD